MHAMHLVHDVQPLTCIACVLYGAATDWAPQWDKNFGTELYNHTVDAHENRNAFSGVQGTAAAAALAERLHGGWEKANIYQ